MRFQFSLFRYGLFVLSTFISAIGIALVTNAHLGTTPITSLPYTVTAICGLSLGTWTFLINITFVVAQKFLLGPTFKLSALLQLPAVFLFSLFIDLWMWITSSWTVSSYPWQVVMSMAGNAVLGLGISIELASKTTVQPGEGMVLAIAYRSHKEFGNIKVLFDVSLVCLSAFLGFISLGSVVGLREGTLLSALTVGVFVRIFGRLTRRIIPSPAEDGKKETKAQ